MKGSRLLVGGKANTQGDNAYRARASFGAFFFFLVPLSGATRIVQGSSVAWFLGNVINGRATGGSAGGGQCGRRQSPNTILSQTWARPAAWARLGLEDAMPPSRSGNYLVTHGIFERVPWHSVPAASDFVYGQTGLRVGNVTRGDGIRGGRGSNDSIGKGNRSQETKKKQLKSRK